MQHETLDASARLPAQCQPAKDPGPAQWQQWRQLIAESGSRRLFLSSQGVYTVSTVMVDMGLPLLDQPEVYFETAVFINQPTGQLETVYEAACVWWHEAAQQHAQACAWVRQQLDLAASVHEIADDRHEQTVRRTGRSHKG